MKNLKIKTMKVIKHRGEEHHLEIAVHPSLEI